MVEQIIIVIKDDSLREKVLPFLKLKYKDKELIVVKSTEEVNGKNYIELIPDELAEYKTVTYEFVKRPEEKIIPYDELIKKERKYRKDQQKLSLRYQNKHFKTAKR